jgi:hypothetical protein
MPNFNLADPDAIFRFLWPDMGAEEIARCRQYSAAFREVLYGKRPRRQRKPNIGRMIAAAERSGKNVISITTPDGLTIHFGKGEPTEASNPWLDDLTNAKQ